MARELTGCAWVAAACAALAAWVGGGWFAMGCATVLLATAVLLAWRGVGTWPAVAHMPLFLVLCFLVVGSLAARLLLRTMEGGLVDEASIMTTYYPDPAYEQAIAVLRYLRNVLAK